MNEVIIYLLKVISIHGLLYLIYWLAFRKSARHALNRGYLLGSLLVAFLIPFLEIPQREMISNPAQSVIITWLNEPSVALEEVELIPVEKASSFSIGSLLLWIYGATAFLLLARSLIYINMLYRLQKQSEFVKKKWYKLFKTSQNRSFSFFSNVFIPQKLFGSNEFQQILAHECVHVRQLHSADRLLLDFVVSLLWFNPFIYLYRSALIEIHEYQADEAVINQFKDPIGYQEVLFSQLQMSQYGGLVSHFNVEMIKKRIVMMNKSKKRTGWIYTLSIPVTLMVIFAFSSRDVMQPLNEVGDELSDLIGPVLLEDSGINFLQETNEPSILPLQNYGKIKMTSGFGERHDPIDDKKKFHKGMDFSCTIGTEIIAPANGKVLKVENKPKGYGKLLTIDHGNGFITRFGQLSEFKVSEGESVSKGQVIALSGNSGRSTGPHLHYEIIKNGENVDPGLYIKNYEFKSSKASSLGQQMIKEEQMRLEEAKAREQEEYAYQEEIEAKKNEELQAKKELEMMKQEEMMALERKLFEKQQLEERKQAEMRALEKELYKEQMKAQKMKEKSESYKVKDKDKSKKKKE